MYNIKLKKILINQIDFDDRSYIFTFESPIAKLIDSIKEIGIINPPILEQKSKNTFRIVSGLKRILASKNLKIEQLDALVHYPKDSHPDLSLFLINLYENIGTRTLNIIEKAMVLHKLIYLFQLSEDEVMEEYFPMLELGANKSVLERYLKLMQLEQELKIAVARDLLAPEIAVALLDRSGVERQTIFIFFQRLKLGKNRQKEFLRLLTEISAIDDRSIDQLLLNNAIEDVLKDDRITPPRKTEYIKAILKKMRYPLFVNIAEQFQNIKKELKLPPSIILRPPSFFEGENYTIEFSFKNQPEFKKWVEVLKSIADKNQLNKLESLV